MQHQRLTLHIMQINGYFKAKPNRSKSKITLKNKLNKKNVVMLLLSDVMDILLNGWYTKKKGGKKYSASTIITKNQKTLSSLVKEI